MDYMFTGKEPQVEGHLMGFWLLVKPNLDTSKNRAKAGQTKSKQNQNKIKPKSKPKPSPLEEKEKEKEKEKELDTRLNAEAFKEWCQYKGSKFKAVSKTKAINQLVKHNKHIQREMIDASIANGWAGLFEPKQKLVSKSNSTTKDAIGEFFNKQNMGEIIDAEIS